MPPRPRMGINLAEILNDTNMHCVMSVMRLWDDWTDAVDNNFRRMIDLAKYLEVSKDMYMDFIRIFAHHPARPDTPSEGEMEQALRESILETRRAAITSLWVQWERHADILQDTHSEVSRQLVHCAFKPGARESMQDGLAGLDLSRLTLSTNEPELQAILASMLGGPGRYDRPIHTLPESSSSSGMIDTGYPTPVGLSFEEGSDGSDTSFPEQTRDFESGGRESLQAILRQLNREFDYPDEPEDLNLERLRMDGDQEMEDANTY